MHRVILPALLLLLAPSFVIAAQQEDDQMWATIYSSDRSTMMSFTPFDEDYRGAGSVAVDDLGDDGTSELLVGAGPGLPPTVTLYRQDGTEIGSFMAYDETFNRGVNVATCDVDGDGKNDIVTAPMFGGGPHVRVFDAWGQLHSEFFAYDQSFHGGVHITCGDVDGNGTDDIITGPGSTGGPHVKVFDKDGAQLFETFVGSADDTSGVTIAAADLDGDGDVEILTGRAGYGDPTIVATDLMNGQLQFVLSLSAFDEYKNGIQVFAGDIDGDGMDEIGASTQGNHQASVVFYEMTGAKTWDLVTDDSKHGIVAAVVPEDASIFSLMTEQKVQNEPGQYIRVDLSEQTLYAYQDGTLVYASLVSTGVPGWETPVDRTQITDKLLWHDYVWYYGPDNPLNYSLLDVKYNLRFRTHYYLHYAYWHNNFGNPMSHGCVNMAYDDAAWIYNWADVGAVVEVVE